MKQSKKGGSYFEKTFGHKSKPESPAPEKEAGKKTWRNKAEFSEAPQRRGKNEVAAPKERAPKAFGDKKNFGGPKKFEDRKIGEHRNNGTDRKPYGKASDERRSFREDKPFKERKKFTDDGNGTERKSFNSDRAPRERKDYQDKPYGERKSFDRKSSDERRSFNDAKGTRASKSFSEKPQGERRPFDKKDSGEGSTLEQKGAYQERKSFHSGKPRTQTSFNDRKAPDNKAERFPNKKTNGGFQREEPLSLHADNEVVREKIGAGKGKSAPIAETPLTEAMPLNKYVAHCGICSRRDAVELIRQGKVKVNGELVTEPGHKVEDGSEITVSGKKVTPQKDLTYVLLNKPKGFITTTEDERGRRTVMDLVSDSGALRLYPIGRLDRNTTGLILLTNDGELSQRLSHPKYNIKKVYHVTLDKAISSEDFEKVLAGVELEDGVAPVDALSMLDERNELGIEIHSGKNRIVRRIFEHLGYEVVKLDRVVYAGLTKKNLPRGKWRKLTEREVIFLKHFKH